MLKSKTAIKNRITYSEKQLKGDNYIRLIFLIILSVILFFPPFVRGLFFEKEQFVVEAFTFGIFILFWIYKFIKKDRGFIKTPIEMVSFGLMVLYLISIIYAISTRDSISEWLKYCMYFSIFFMLSELLITFKLRRAYLWFVSGVAVLLCLTGIDGAAGGAVTTGINKALISMGAQNNLFFEVFMGGRIYSSLQYPNALASYVMAAFIIVVGLGATYSNRWIKSLSGAIAGLLFLTFILTFSRGAYILVPIAVIVLLIILPRGGRIRMLSFGLIPMIISVPFSLALSKYMGEKTEEGIKVWLLTIGCMAVSGLITYGYTYISGVLERISWKVYAVILAGITILVFIGTAVAFNTDSSLVLEHTDNEADSYKAITRKFSLEQGKDYTLQINIDAGSPKDNPYTYQISIDSRNIKDILSNVQKQLTILSEKDTSGVSVKNLDFTVPIDSEEVIVTFINYYQGTKVIFNNAVIIDKANKDIVKKLKLNYKYIPESIAQRFENLGSDASNIQRQIYYKDAMEIIKDRWLLGGGGKAWEKLYFSYQSFGYSSTQAHNYFLQVAVETGAVGIILLLLLIASIVYMYYRGYYEGSLEERVLQAALLAAILSMLAHSAMDFDLSLSAVYLLLWQLLAVYNSRCRKEQPDTDKIKNPFLKTCNKVSARIYALKVQPVIVIIILIVIVYFPISYRSALSHAESYDRYGRANNAELAITNLKKATEQDPLNGVYNLKYLSYLLAKKNATQGEMDKVVALTKKVEKASSYDVNLATSYATSLLKAGNIEKGMKYMDHAIGLRPHYPVQWKAMINACYQIAIFYLSAGDINRAFIYADKGFMAMEEARQKNEESMAPFSPDTEMMNNLEKLKYIRDNAKNDKMLDVNAILFYNIPSMDINIDGVPDQWTIDNPSKTKLESSEKGMSVVGEGFIQSRQLNFAAGKKYKIEVKVQTADKTGNIPFIIAGVMSENGFLEYSDGKFSGTLDLSGSASAMSGALRLELPSGCIVEEVLVGEV